MPAEADRLVERARTAVARGEGGAEGAGLVRLPGGMTHHVFAPADDPAVVVKVFTTSGTEAASREWDALVAFAGTGLAPEPVRLDVGDPPVVVMSRALGAPLPGASLGRLHAERIGAAHQLVHRHGSPPSSPAASAALVGLSLALERRSPSPGEDDTVVDTWKAARSWVGAFDLAPFLSAGERSFTRGDPNLGNYLWHDEGLALVDWEDCGPNDPVLEVADMAEHASTRDVEEPFWDELAAATGLSDADRRRVADARRLMACFWLVLIEQRTRDGRPTTVTIEAQARRTLDVLSR